MFTLRSIDSVQAVPPVKPPLATFKEIDKGYLWGTRWGCLILLREEGVVRLKLVKNNNLQGFITAKFDKHGHFRMYFKIKRKGKWGGLSDIKYSGIASEVQSLSHRVFGTHSLNRPAVIEGWHDPNDHVLHHFALSLVEVFGSSPVTSKEDTPFAQSMQLINYARFPSLRGLQEIPTHLSKRLAKAFSKPTIQDATYDLFKTRGKKTVKLVCESFPQPSKLEFFSFLVHKGWDINHIHKLAKSNLGMFALSYTYEVIYFFMSQYTQATATRGLIAHPPIYARDTKYLYDLCKARGVEYTLPKKMNLNAIHDELVALYQKISHQDFDLPDRFRLDGVQIGPMKLISPKTNHTLIDWGEQLSICVGSYGTHVINDVCNVYGVEVDGSLAYCVNLGPSNRPAIVEFKQRFNALPPEEHRELLKEWLGDAKLHKRVQRSKSP